MLVQPLVGGMEIALALVIVCAIMPSLVSIVGRVPLWEYFPIATVIVILREKRGKSNNRKKRRILMIYIYIYSV